MLSSFTKNHRWALALMIALVFVGTTSAAKRIFIAVTQITSHSALDAVREGLHDSLVKYAKRHDVELIWLFENAQGNIGTATQIAQKFAGLEPDLIVAISTPSAQTVLAATRNADVPVVFSAVTDPVAAKLVATLEKPGGKATGTYDAPPVAEQLDLMLKLDPEVKTVGILFNPGEINSVRQLERFHEEAKARKLKVVEGPCLKSTEVIPAAQRLFSEVDAVYVPQDNTVVSSLPGVARLALRHGIPLIAPDPEGVKVGALATVGFSHYQEGVTCAEIVLKILQGAHPADIPVQQPKDKKIYINASAFKALGIDTARLVKDMKVIDEKE